MQMTGTSSGLELESKWTDIIYSCKSLGNCGYTYARQHMSGEIFTDQSEKELKHRCIVPFVCPLHVPNLKVSEM